MDELLAQLRATYNEAHDKASRIAAPAKAERREMSESEAGQFEAAIGEVAAKA